MKDNERIIEVNGYSEPVRIYWHKDPTRHLHSVKAVNAKIKSDDATRPIQSKTPPSSKGNDSLSGE